MDVSYKVVLPVIIICGKLRECGLVNMMQRMAPFRIVVRP